jgi:nitrite reductase (NADH) small subunit
MSKFKRIASLHDIPLNRGLKVKYKDKFIALFRHNDRVYAIQNRCPHQHADLADGTIVKNKLYCPMHNWAFDITTGAFAFNPDQKLKTYRVLIEDNEVFLDES